LGTQWPSLPLPKKGIMIVINNNHSKNISPKKGTIIIIIIITQKIFHPKRK
jgi:hypothetical protein